jgi:L-aminopeptidase/D-esterase-like protein
VASEELTLTSVPGFLAGHAQDLEAATGCTVVTCPPGTAGAVEQRGGAPGTRETDLLRGGRLVQAVDAVLLAGGSAFGLGAADGVLRFLEERGRGFPTPAGVVPIVPAAILYDLEVGSAAVRPDAPMGYAAALAASAAPVEQGSVGAGAGCRVGGLLGSARATKGGIGSAALRLSNGVIAGALFAVNAFGDVIDERGEVLAGVRAAPGESGKTEALELLLANPSRRRYLERGSTVLGVIATNARLSRDELQRVACMAHDGIARAVRPSHTLFDGDTVFALAAGDREADPSAVGAAAAEATARAIRNAVRRARSLGGVPAMSDLRT